MNLRSIPMHARVLLENMDKLGANLDAASRKHIESSLELATQIDEYSPDASELAEAVVDALARGVDPLDDHAVARAHLASSIGQVRHTFADTTSLRLQEALLAEWPAILAAFKKPFNAAGEQLEEAHRALTRAGLTELTNTSPTHSEALAVMWVRAHEAIRALETIRNIIGGTTVSLGQPARYMNDARMYDTHGEPTDHRVITSSWEALGKGWSIDLATPGEYEKRRHDADETLKQRAAEEWKAQKREIQHFSR